MNVGVRFVRHIFILCLFVGLLFSFALPVFANDVFTGATTGDQLSWWQRITAGTGLGGYDYGGVGPDGTEYYYPTETSFGETYSSYWSEATGVASLKSLPLKIAFAIGGVLLGIIASILSFLASILVHISVYFFDIALVIATDGLSQIVASGSQTSQAIKEGWIIIRDLANIGFVFILLYIAINFILSAESSSTKKLLSNTILAAILINFSFFFAAVVIDVANQLAVELRTDVDTVWKNSGAGSLAEFIIQSTNIDQTVTTIKESTDMGGGEGGSQIANSLEGIDSGNASLLDRAIQWGIGSTMMFILLLILAITFMIASFILIARTIVLILLLITSPIGFAGFVLPYTKKMAREWWQSLVGQAFFLPVFLLFILIAVKLIEAKILGINFSPVTETTTSIPVTGVQKDIVTLGKNIAGGVIQYAIVIGLFIAALTSAKKLSSMGSDIVTKLSGSITSTVGGAAMGLTGAVGRNTVGWGANKLVNSNAVQDKLANRGFGLGNLALKTMSGVAGSSMDVRGSRAFSGVASATGLGGSVLGDTGGKGGFAQQLKNSDDAKAKFAKDVLKDANADKEKELFEKEQRGAAAAQRLLETAKVDGDKNAIKAAQQRVYDAEKRVEDRKKAYNDQKNSRRIKYAADIGTPTTGPMKAAKWTRDFIGAQGRSAAISSKIMKEASKSKTDELLEALIKVEKDQNVQDRTIAKQAAKNNP